MAELSRNVQMYDQKLGARSDGKWAYRPMCGTGASDRIGRIGDQGLHHVAVALVPTSGKSLQVGRRGERPATARVP
jgi:hypothetical protein